MEKIQNRIDWIDVARGFAIFWVVSAHIETWSNLKPVSLYNYTMEIIATALFFFISGFCFDFYKEEPFLLFLKKKLPLLTVTVILGSCYVFAFGYDLRDLFFSYMKLGFWFTFVLFEVFILLWVSQKITKPLASRPLLRFSSLLFFPVIFAIALKFDIISSQIDNFLSVQALLVGFLFVWGGYLDALLQRLIQKTFFVKLRSSACDCIVYLDVFCTRLFCYKSDTALMRCLAAGDVFQT